MSDIKLNPCPFCGSDNIHLFPGYFPYADYIVCKNCKAHFKTNTYLTDEQMAEAWNKRAEPENVVHAHWFAEKDDGGFFDFCLCSNCKFDFGNEIAWVLPSAELPYYCPRCGAKMDEEGCFDGCT